MDDITRYSEVHKTAKGAGDARPTAQDIIQDEKLASSLTDKVILITGCSSGLGIETAKALAVTGATLYLTARNLTKARTALGHDLVSSPKVHLLEMDLTSLDSVRSCADTFLSQSSQLNILITNAGIRNTPYGRTKDGFEQQFGVNHLAHFLLFQKLKATLLSSATPDFNSRVVALSSTGHRDEDMPINFDNLNWSSDGSSGASSLPYTPGRGYTQSKLANIYMTNEIDRRYGSQGLHANAVMPGGIMTGLQQGNNGGALWEVLSDWRLLLAMPRTMKLMKNAEQGAATTVWAAVATALEGRGGLYLENCGIAQPMAKGSIGLDPGYGVHAFDVGAAKRLWDTSCELVDVPIDP